MPLIGETRLRLMKCGGGFVPMAANEDRSCGPGGALALHVAVVGLLFVCSATLLSIPRGLPLDTSFYNRIYGHVIPYPAGWIAGYGDHNVTHIRRRVSGGSQCDILFRSRRFTSFEVPSGTTDPLSEIAVAVALDNGFTAPARSYRIRRLRFMGTPGVLIEGSVQEGWGSLAMAFNGTEVHILLMTAPSRLVDRTLAATWAKMIRRCRPAAVEEIGESPPWE